MFCHCHGIWRNCRNADNPVYLGLSPAHMADLSYRGVWRPAQSTANEMRVRAGGRLIFEGDITDAYADYNQAPDIPLILTGQVSFNLRNQTAADFSAKGDVPVADIIRALASSAGLKFENQGVSRSLSNPHFSGNLVQQMLDAASAADINIDLGTRRKSPSGRRTKPWIFRLCIFRRTTGLLDIRSIP